MSIKDPTTGRIQICIFQPKGRYYVDHEYTTNLYSHIKMVVVGKHATEIKKSGLYAGVNIFSDEV